MYNFLYRVYLIGSTPGRYQGPAMEKWGHLRLRKVIFCVIYYAIFLCDSSIFPSKAVVPLHPRLKNDWCSWKSIVRLQDALELYSSCLIYWVNSDNTGRVRCWIGLCKIQKLSQEKSVSVLKWSHTEHCLNSALIWMTDSHRAHSLHLHKAQPTSVDLNWWVVNQK